MHSREGEFIKMKLLIKLNRVLGKLLLSSSQEIRYIEKKLRDSYIYEFKEI